MLNFGENMIVFPDNRGAIGAETINGNPRGLNHPCSDGTILRPSLVLVDEPQSRGVAKSPTQVQNTIEIIDGDIAGLSGSGKALPILLSGNCIYPHDVMYHFLNQKEWRGVVVPRVVTWCDGFLDEQSETRKLWEEWNQLRIYDEVQRTGFKNALEFYKKHKQEMIRNMQVSAMSSVDPARKHPDAYYAAMDLYFTIGHQAFFAEYQQSPVPITTSSYSITPQLILSRTSGFNLLECEEGAEIYAGIDINYIGFSYVILACDHATQTRKVVAHGLFPAGANMILKGSTNAQACGVIRKMMGVFIKEFLEKVRVNAGGKTIPIRAAVWDASNGSWQTSISYAIKESRSSVNMLPLKAFSSKGYKPRISDKRQGDGWHLASFNNIGLMFCINADKWRETMQRGFVVNSAEAGSISLYEDKIGSENRKLANEICGERLVEKVITDKAEYYNWAKTPGVANDRADALVYACALGALMGMGELKVSRKRRIVKPSMQTVRI
jgi:hypothetical protein